MSRAGWALRHGTVGAPIRLSPEQEQSLLEAHRGGDPTAISTLLRGFQHRIYSVCYRMMRDPDLAADLTQDSMLKVIQGLPGYDGRASLSTWIVRVTMNTCLSELRKRKVRRHASLDDHDAGSVPIRSRLSNPQELAGGDRVERAEVHRSLTDALASLEPEPRAILVLRDLQGLDYEQISAVLDIPLGTVKSRLFRARAALRRLLEERIGAVEPTDESA